MWKSCKIGPTLPQGKHESKRAAGVVRGRYHVPVWSSNTAEKRGGGVVIHPGLYKRPERIYLRTYPWSTRFGAAVCGV